MWGNWWSLLPSPAEFLIVIDKYYHPDADLTVAPQKRSAVNPTVSAVFIGSGNPAHLGCYASTFCKCSGELITDPGGATNPVHERRLKYARNSQCWRSKQYTE